MKNRERLRACESIQRIVRSTRADAQAIDEKEKQRHQVISSIQGEHDARQRDKLIDKSNLRLPSDRITANDGTVMEMNPRPVDLLVDKPVGESYLGRDSQLDSAVVELLKQLGSSRK